MTASCLMTLMIAVRRSRAAVGAGDRGVLAAADSVDIVDMT